MNAAAWQAIAQLANIGTSAMQGGLQIRKMNQDDAANAARIDYENRVLNNTIGYQDRSLELQRDTLGLAKNNAQYENDLKKAQAEYYLGKSAPKNIGISGSVMGPDGSLVSIADQGADGVEYGTAGSGNTGLSSPKRPVMNTDQFVSRKTMEIVKAQDDIDLAERQVTALDWSLRNKSPLSNDQAKAVGMSTKLTEDGIILTFAARPVVDQNGMPVVDQNGKQVIDRPQLVLDSPDAIGAFREAKIREGVQAYNELNNAGEALAIIKGDKWTERLPKGIYSREKMDELLNTKDSQLVKKIDYEADSPALVTAKKAFMRSYAYYNGEDAIAAYARENYDPIINQQFNEAFPAKAKQEAAVQSNWGQIKNWAGAAYGGLQKAVDYGINLPNKIPEALSNAYRSGVGQTVGVLPGLPTRAEVTQPIGSLQGLMSNVSLKNKGGSLGTGSAAPSAKADETISYISAPIQQAGRLVGSNIKNTAQGGLQPIMTVGRKYIEKTRQDAQDVGLIRPESITIPQQIAPIDPQTYESYGNTNAPRDSWRKYYNQ